VLEVDDESDWMRGGEASITETPTRRSVGNN
jgi:hypothetical protein